MHIVEVAVFFAVLITKLQTSWLTCSKPMYDLC